MSDPNPTCAQLPVTTEPDYLRDRLTQAITAGIRRADDQARKPHTVFAGDAERYAPYVADALAPVLAQLDARATQEVEGVEGKQQVTAERDQAQAALQRIEQAAREWYREAQEELLPAREYGIARGLEEAYEDVMEILDLPLGGADISPEERLLRAIFGTPKG